MLLQRESEPSVLPDEYTFLKSVIDLALARRPPSQSRGRRGDEDQYLPLSSIISTHNELAHQLKISPALEERTYQLLLLMSAEEKLTWWEKVQKIPQYLKALSKKQNKSSMRLGTSSISPDKSRFADRSNTTYSLGGNKTVTDGFLRVSNQQKKDLIGRISTTAPSDLEEGAELSFLLNQRIRPKVQPAPPSGPASSATDLATSYAVMTTPIRDTTSHNIEEKISSIEKETKVTQGLLSNLLHRFDQVGQPNFKPPDSSGKDHPLATLDHTMMANHNPLLSPVPKMMQSGAFADTFKLGSPELSVAGEDTGLSTIRRLEARRFAANPTVQDFSKSLKRSTVMSKYLNSQKKKLNRSQHDVDKEENAESGIRRTSEDLTLRDISPSKQGTFTASQLHSSPGKRMTKIQRNITFADFDDEKEGMPADVEQERGNNTAEPFSSPKGRQSSIDIISSLQSPNSQRKKFEMNAFLKELTIDPSYLPLEEQDPSYHQHHPLSDGTKSSIKLLILFQQYVLAHSPNPLNHSQPSKHRHDHQQSSRILPLQFYHHLTDLSPFVSSLFGLEQWIRDKMKEFVSREALRQIFVFWSLDSGVNTIGRQYYRKSLLRKGLEYFMEYNVKSRLRRKSILKLYMWRRIQLTGGEGGSHYQHNSSVTKGLSTGMALFTSSENRSYRNMMTNMSPSLHKSKHSANFRNMSRFGTSSRKNVFYYQDDEEDAEKTKGDNRSFDKSDFLVDNITMLSPSKKRLSTSDLGMTSTGQNPPTTHAQRYSTSLSLRHLLHQAQYAHHTLYRDMINVGVAGGGNQQNIGHVRHADYLYAQDLIALLFAFRRFYRRTIDLKHYRRIRQLHNTRTELGIFQLWHEYYQKRKVNQQVFEPFIIQLQHESYERRKKEAFYTLLRNVTINKQRQTLYKQLKEKIYKKKIFIQAAMMMGYPYYIRCFLRWKRTYDGLGGITRHRQEMINDFYYSYKRRRFLMKWHDRIISLKRKNLLHIMRMKDLKIVTSLHYLYVPSFLLLSQHKDHQRRGSRTKEGGGGGVQSGVLDHHHGSVETKHLRSHLIKYGIQLSYMKRFLLRWKKRVLLTKLWYPSFIEMKFHYLYMRFSNDLLSTSEKLQYRKLINKMRSVMFLRQIDYFSHRFDSQQQAPLPSNSVFPSSDGSMVNENYSNSFAAAKEKEKEYYLLMNHYFHRQEIEQRRIREGENDEEESVRSTSQRQWMMFTSSALTSSPLLYTSEYDVAVAMSGGDVSTSKSHQHQHHSMKYIHYFLSYYYQKLYLYHYNPHYTNYFNTILQPQLRERERLKEQEKEREQMRLATAGLKSAPNIISSTSSEPSQVPAPSTKNQQHLPFGEYLSMFSQPASHRNLTIDTSSTKNSTFATSNQSYDMIAIFSIYIRRWKYHAALRVHSKTKALQLKKKRLLKIFFAWREHYHLVHTVAMIQKRRHWQRWKQFRFSHRIFTKRSSYKVNDYLRQKAMNQWKHYLNYHYDNSVQQNQSFYNHMIQTVPLKKYDYIVYKMRKHLKDNENNYFYNEYEKFLFYVEGKLLFHQFSLPPPIIITPRVQRSSSLSPSNRGKTSPRAGGSPPTPRRMMKSNKQTLRIFIDTVMKEEKQGGEEGVGGGNSSSVNYSSSFFPSSYNNNQQEKFISAKLLKRYLLSLLQQYSQSSSGLSRLMKVTRQRHQMRVAKQRASSFKLYHGLHHFMNYHYFGKLRKAVRQLKMKKVLLTWKGELLRHRITIPRMTTDAFRQFRHHYKQRVYYRVYKALIRDKYEYVFRRLQSHGEDCHSKEKRLSEYLEQKRLLTAWAEWQQLFYMNMLYKRKMMLKSLSYYHHQLYPLQQLKNHNHYLLKRVYLPSKYFHKLLKNIYLKKKYYHLLEVYGQLYYLQRLRIYCFNNLYQIITRKRQKKFLLNDSEVKTLNLPNMKNLLLQEVFAWKEKEFYRYQKVYWKTQEINHPKKISLLTINRMKNKKKKILTLIHKYSNYCRYSYLFQPSYTLLTSNLTSIQWKKKLFRLSTFSSSLTMDFHQQLLAQQEQQQQAQSKGKNKANNKIVGKGIPSLTQQPTLPMSPLSPLVRGGLGSPMSALRRELFDDFAADGEEDVLQGGAKSPTVPWNYRQTQPPQLHPLLPLNVSAITTAPLTYDRKKGSTGERRDRGGDAGAADRAYELYSQSVLTKYDTSGISVKQSVGGGQVSLKDEFDEDEREDNDDVLDEQIRSFHSHSRTHSPAGRSKNPVGEDGDDLPPPPSYQHLLNQTTSTTHTLKTTISQKSGRRQRFNSDSSTDVKDQIHDDNDHGEEVVTKGSIVIPTSSIKREIAVTEDDHFDYDDQEEGQSDNEDDYYQDGDDEIRPQIGLSKTFPTTSSKSRHGNKTAALARALTPTRSRPPSTRHTPSHPDVIVPTSISFEARFSEDSVVEGEEEDGDDRLNHTAMSRLTSSLSRSTTIDRLKKKDTMASENERDKLNIQTTLPSMTSAPSSHRSRRTSSTSPPRSTSTVGRRVPSEPPPSSDLRGRRMNETLNLSTLTTPSPHQPPPSTSNKKSLKLDLTPRYFDDTQPAIPQSSSILHPPFTSPMASAAPLTMSALLNRSDSVRPPPLTTATLKSTLSPILKQPSSVQTSRPPTGRGPASRPEPLQSFSPLRSPQPPPLSSLTGVAGGGLTRGEGFFFPKTPDSRNDADSTVMTSDTYSTHYPQSPNPSSPARLTRSQSQNQSRSQNQSQSQYRTTSQTFFNATPSNYLDGGVEDDAFTSTAMLAEQIANYHQTVRQVLRCSPRHNLRLLKHLLATTTQTPEDDASPYHPLIQKRFFLFKLLRRRYYRHTLLSVVTSHYLLPKYQKMVLKRLRQYALQKKRRRHYQNKRLLVYALAQWINRMNEKKSQRYLTQRYAASFHLIVSLTSVLRRWRKVCMSHDRNGRSAMERAIYFHHKRRLVTAIMCWKAVAMLTLLKRRRGGDSGSAMTLTTRDDDTLSSVTEYHLQSPRYPSSSFYNSGIRAPRRRKIGNLMDFYHSSAMKRQKRRKIRNFDGDKDDIAENEEQATSVYQRFLRQTQRQSQRYQSSRILSSAVKGEGTRKERRRNSMKGEAEKEISDVRDRRDRSRERERRDNIGRVNANADSLGSRTKELMKQRGISTPKVKTFN